MMKLKMYGRFVLWLLKKVLTLGGAATEFFKYWKEAVTREFGVSVLMFILVTIVSTVTSLLGFVVVTAAQAKPPIECFGYSVLNSSIMYGCVIISALYDVFLKEYERTFTILKED